MWWKDLLLDILVLWFVATSMVSEPGGSSELPNGMVVGNRLVSNGRKWVYIYSLCTYYINISK